MRLISVLFVLLFGLTACAGAQRYATGIPASGTQKFYFHMEKEARDRGYTTTRDDGLSIDVQDGWLQYDVLGDEISLVITVKRAGDMSEDEIATKQANLKALSDDLVAKARARSDAAKSFE